MTVQCHERQLLCTFFSSNIICFGQNKLTKVHIFETFEGSCQSLSNSLCQFRNDKSILLQTLHHSSVSWDITPPCFLAEIVHTFNKKNLSKCKFRQISCDQSKVWIFALWWDKVSAKKVQNSYFSWYWRVLQSLKKNWLVVSNITWEICRIFTQPLKNLKISLRWALFIQSI